MQRRFSGRVMAILVLLTLALLGGTAVTQAFGPISAVMPFANAVPTGVLSFADRVACQRAIEEVYWQYRIWPAENPTPKPTLDTVLSSTVLRARTEDTLRLSNALETVWGQSVTGEMLQAEMDRIATTTRQPEILRDVFNVLDNDPTLVADCLARPLLVERLAHNWYAQDKRFHADIEAEAIADLASVGSIAELQNTSGIYQETTWTVAARDTTTPAAGIHVVDESAWDAQREVVAAPFGVAVTAIPTGTVSDLQEDDTGFFAFVVLEQSDTAMRVATVRWQKVAFATWWEGESAQFAATVAPLDYPFALPAITGDATAMGDSSWLPTPSLPTRTNGTAIWTGADMIIWGGGSIGTGASNEGWRYNPAVDSWFTISNINAPLGRFRHTAIWTGTEMIVWGGCSSQPFRLCELANGGRYNPMTGVWTLTSVENEPDARLDHTAVWTGAEMIVWGGCAPDANTTCPPKNTGGRYDPATDTWTDTTVANAPTARDLHTAVWTDAEMIVWGGEVNNGSATTDTGGRYNPETDTWTPTTSTTAPAPRLNHTAVWTGDEMIVWGGCPVIQECLVQGTSVNSGARYNPDTDTWTPTTVTNAPSARTDHTAVWTGAEMIIWGGGTTSTFFNTGGRYDPDADVWTSTATTNAPSPRATHRAVWTGSLMIVWGGTDVTGGRYDPATNSWTPTDTEDPDALRAKHTAVWTGVEMIIWGGDDISGTTDMGRIYNPTTRTWREVTMTNRPFFRVNHTAVWTGSEMLVWGGNANGTLLGDGGRYNPVNDTWTDISTTAAPDPRFYHVAVWTGSEMLVWGGGGEEGDFNNGGRYNPTTNSWTPTATSGAPTPRQAAEAVWTGSEMLVWGGLVAYEETNTGGRYNPATNTWAAISMTNAPEPRFDHTAIWTGDRMIVWGGGDFDFDAPVLYNNGARYDPATNTWQATSLVEAPEGRVSHTAVWTGAKMIVWGGCTGATSCGTPIFTGGEYDPLADTWEPTVIDGGTPRARGEHSAVWTGESMIVWGGYTNASTYTNTGSEYFTEAPGNQPPVATNDVYTTSANQTLTIPAPGVLANDTDADGNTLSASVLTQPEHGILTLNSNGSLTYVPDSGFVGNDGFTYRAFDGTAFSNAAGVSITVSGAGSTPTNTPVATAISTNTPTPIPPTPLPGTLTPTSVNPSMTPTQTPAAPTTTPTGTIVVPSTTPTGSPVPPSATPTRTITPTTTTPTGTVVVPGVTPTTSPQEGYFLYLPVVER